MNHPFANLRTCLLLYVALMLSPLLNGQSPVIIDNVSAQFIRLDISGNLYVVDEAHLYKYNLSGELLCSYTDFSLGAIQSVDVSNPMKIMLFYKDAGTILFLDNHLAVIGNKLNLYAHNINTITLASCLSKNKLLLYDQANMDFIIVDFFLNQIDKIHSTFQHFNPKSMSQINENTLVVHNPSTGILFFDNFCSYEKTIAILTDNDFQMIGSDIYYLADNKLIKYDCVRLAQTELSLPDSTAKQVILFKNKKVLLTEQNRVMIY